MRAIKIKVVDFGQRDTHPEELFLINILSRFYKVEISENPDFLIYACQGLEHRDKKYDKCIKIFYTNENVCPDFNECDYAIGVDRISFGERYLRQGYGVKGLLEIGFKSYPSIKNDRVVDESLLNRKFCNFIFFNKDSGEGAVLREKFCKELSKYKKVDCPGMVLNNMSSKILAPRYKKNDLESKLEFIKDYKFTIAFENSASDDYITEKIIHPFVAYSMPIYWGAANIGIDFNEKSFINCNLCNNDVKKMVELVAKIDNDDELYLSMMRQKPFQPSYKFNEEEEIASFLQNIVETGKRYNKDPRNWGAKGQEAGLSYKHWRLFNCSTEWLKLRQNGKKLLDFFDVQGLTDVAIYGAGDLGMCLLDELIGSKVNVKYFIDRKKRGKVKGIPICGVDESLVKVDAIIVTAIVDFETIKRSLSKIAEASVISLEEIIMYMSQKV